MISKHDRLDGWKAIASFFGRDRTTAIRWARERDLPIHAMPGGKTRTVYALVSELEAWARSQDEVAIGSSPLKNDTLVSVSDAPPRGPRHRSLPAWIWLPGGTVIAAALAFAISARPLLHSSRTSLAPARQTLPAEPAIAALFLQARDDWAERSSASLARSIQEFQRVVSQAPDFAPAAADLADAYLLDTEDGSLPAAVAFDGAQHAADLALKLDPSSAAAHRASGFVQYWWKHDAAAAGREFREAIRLDPNAAQSHFWYANVLADDGEAVQAMREFDRARLAEPGSDQIGADYAWALWMSGRGLEALARLREIVDNHPDNLEALDCLGTISLAGGDTRTFLLTLKKRASLRQDPLLTTQAQALATAFDRGGSASLLTSALSIEMTGQANAPYPDHSVAAFYAGIAGDRAGFLRIAGLAKLKGEQWGASGYVRYIRSRWPSDAAVEQLLTRLSGPLVEGGSVV